MYERGEGVERDAVQALRHFEQAAELGSPSGQFNTGRAYNGAIGVPGATPFGRVTGNELADAHEVRGYPALVGPIRQNRRMAVSVSCRTNAGCFAPANFGNESPGPGAR